MKVLFLDIDGVLNSQRSCVALGGYPHRVDQADQLQMFDQIAINLLRGLCVKADLSVVVSSSWRVTNQWDEIGRALELPTICSTPNGGASRGHEIQEWLDAHPDVTEYAIVDDDNDMLPSQQDRFVQTSGFDGLRWQDFERLCQLFGLQPYDCAARREFKSGGMVKLDWEAA